MYINHELILPLNFCIFISIFQHFLHAMDEKYKSHNHYSSRQVSYNTVHVSIYLHSIHLNTHSIILIFVSYCLNFILPLSLPPFLPLSLSLPPCLSLSLSLPLSFLFPQVNPANKELQRDEQFLIKHYAGDVTYTISCFIDKNKDPVFQDFKRLLYNRFDEFYRCRQL